MLLAFAITGCKLYYETFYTDPDKCLQEAILKKPYDVVIVPGFPSDSARINKTLSDRIFWVNYLYKNGFTGKIMFSGGAVHTPYVESEIMKAYAMQLDIPEEDILLETKALHSTENLYYSWRDAKEMGLNQIGFATHPAQSSFMKQFRRKFKIDLDFVPIVADTIANENFEFKSLVAEDYFVDNFTPLNEKEGLFKRLRGTRGRQVKKEIKAERKKSNNN